MYEKTKCPYCGGEFYGDVCPYCNNTVVRNEQTIANLTQSAETQTEPKPQYPYLDCKEVNVTFFSVGFPLIFGLGFGAGAIGPIVIATNPQLREVGAPTSAFLVPALVCGLISVVALYIASIPFRRRAKVRKNGTIYQGTVHSYEDDPSLLINGMPAQIVNILIQTSEGPKLVRYQLGKTSRPYPENSQLTIKMFENIIEIQK